MNHDQLRGLIHLSIFCKFLNFLESFQNLEENFFSNFQNPGIVFVDPKTKKAVRAGFQKEDFLNEVIT